MNAKNIFGAFCVAIALFFLWPSVFGSWSEMQALRAALAERVTLNDARIAILTKAAAEYVKFQKISTGESGKNLAEVGPVKKEVAEVISAVQDIATTSGLQLSQLQIAQLQGKESDAYHTMTLDIEMAGSYPALRTFLGSLEQYVRILNVSTIQISADQAGAGLKFALKAEAYFIK